MGLGRGGRGVLRHKALRRLEPKGDEDVRLRASSAPRAWGLGKIIAAGVAQYAMAKFISSTELIKGADCQRLRAISVSGFHPIDLCNAPFIPTCEPRN